MSELTKKLNAALDKHNARNNNYNRLEGSKTNKDKLKRKLGLTKKQKLADILYLSDEELAEESFY